VIGEHDDHEWCKTFSFALDNGTICVAAMREVAAGEKGTISFIDTNDQKFPPFLNKPLAEIGIMQRPSDQRICLNRNGWLRLSKGWSRRG
jgi:hypothetical protein